MEDMWTSFVIKVQAHELLSSEYLHVSLNNMNKINELGNYELPIKRKWFIIPDLSTWKQEVEKSLMLINKEKIFR